MSIINITEHNPRNNEYYFLDCKNDSDFSIQKIVQLLQKMQHCFQ